MTRQDKLIFDLAAAVLLLLAHHRDNPEMSHARESLDASLTAWEGGEGLLVPQSE